MLPLSELFPLKLLSVLLVTRGWQLFPILPPACFLLLFPSSLANCHPQLFPSQELPFPPSPPQGLRQRRDSCLCTPGPFTWWPGPVALPSVLKAWNQSVMVQHHPDDAAEDRYGVGFIWFLAPGVGSFPRLPRSCDPWSARLLAIPEAQREKQMDWGCLSPCNLAASYHCWPPASALITGFLSASDCQDPMVTCFVSLGLPPRDWSPAPRQWPWSLADVSHPSHWIPVP